MSIWTPYSAGLAAPAILIGVAVLAASADAVDGDIDRCADLAHPLIA